MRPRFAPRLVLLLASVPLACGGWWTYGEWRFDAGLSCARADLAARRFDAARQWLASQPIDRPEHAEVVYLLGVCEEALGHADAAAAALARVPPASRFGIDAVMVRARVLMKELGRYSEAEDAPARRCRAGHSADAASLRYSLAQLLFWEGRVDEMRQLSQGGWESSPDWPGDLHDLWRIDHAPPMFEKIRAAVEAAGRTAPDDDRLWLARANLAIHEGRLDEAARWLDASLDAAPTIPSSGGPASAGPGRPTASRKRSAACRTCPPTASPSPRCSRSAPGSPPTGARPTPSGPRSSA